MVLKTTLPDFSVVWGVLRVNLPALICSEEHLGHPHVKLAKLNALISYDEKSSVWMKTHFHMEVNESQSGNKLTEVGRATTKRRRWRIKSRLTLRVKTLTVGGRKLWRPKQNGANQCAASLDERQVMHQSRILLQSTRWQWCTYASFQPPKSESPDGSLINITRVSCLLLMSCLWLFMKNQVTLIILIFRHHF